jgi:peptide/nickel transport system substrate-binding protein
MIARAFKLRFRRQVRMQKRQVEAFGQQAEQQLDRNFFRRLERLAGVRRFVATWSLLLILLAGCVLAQMRGLNAYFQDNRPVPGGTYSEGVLGAFTNANPLYAIGPVDVAVSKLLFAGLFTYDASNNLIGDLAKDYTVDTRGTTYTVHLKPGLTWHDGKPLTAKDVLFTYQTIQNADAQSPLSASWQGIKISTTDDTTITFVLPNLLASFPYSLTNGIVPEHVLGDASPAALRSLPFNTSKPIGAGPFMLRALEVQGGSVENRQESIALEPFADYNRGKPKLSRFVVRSFRDKEAMIASYRQQEINAMSGLTELPAGLTAENSHVYNMPLTAEVMTFFKMTEGVLADQQVRQALVRGADVPAIIAKLDYPTIPVRGPLLQNQLGYNAAYNQAAYNPAEAKTMLEKQGWLPGRDGIRTKDGKPLYFALTVQEGSEYAKVAAQLRQQWRAIGVDVEIDAQSASDFQVALAGHAYEALLYGISIGKDPDVYVYWDSTQADARLGSRLNFSEYKSSAADAALQAGRTRSDPTLRSVKYQPFLQAWQNDAPALGLYQPRFLYITRSEVAGLTEHTINADAERLTNVHNWMIRRAGVAQNAQ